MNAYSKDMMNSFEPDAADTRALRDAFGAFATGVTIITCASDDGPVCVTANSFSSISLDPPLVMWAGARAAQRFGHFQKAPHFAVHVLAAGQEELCMDCARDAQALTRHAHGQSPDGVPLLGGCLARFECEQYSYHDAGDHVIVLGKVLRVSTGQGDPLTFYAGKLGGIAQK